MNAKNKASSNLVLGSSGRVTEAELLAVCAKSHFSKIEMTIDDIHRVMLSIHQLTLHYEALIKTARDIPTYSSSVNIQAVELTIDEVVLIARQAVDDMKQELSLLL